jgi:hypothetical protein
MANLATHVAAHNTAHRTLRTRKSFDIAAVMKLHKRGSTLYLRKRVPMRYKRVDDREYIWLSLHTDSESVAQAKVTRVWSDIIEAWEAKLDGADDEGEGRMRAARELAAKRGFRFMAAREVANLPLNQILDRVEAVVTPKGKVDRIEAAAILGGARPPLMTVTRALKAYWKIARDKTLPKSDDQIRRWENPRKKAVANFIAAIGEDMAIADITTRDLRRFKDWWVTKIEVEKLTPNSANKDFIHLTAMLRDVAVVEEIPIGFETKGLSIKEGEREDRPPFSVDWIKSRLLAEGALDGLNPEARGILLGMINTGYRPSEGAMLTADQIILSHNVPHLRIEPVGRQLKSKYARRVIPLTGISLESFRAFPNGFPRYADNPGLSDTINKYLRENCLMESPKHTLYSLRHSFEDRMLRGEVDERIRRDLMGHRLTQAHTGTLRARRRP